MSHPDWIGTTLGGRYKLEALLGQGGMSAVYLGADPNLNRRVAIKLIHSHLTADPLFVRRFEAEAEAVAKLRHPNIIQVFDFDHDGPTYYMVLEHLPGETLHARLERLNAAGQPLPLREAVDIAAAIGDAVHYAHELGLIHRDIKPANIMLGPRGQTTLMDFGIAKLADTTGITATGAVVGTAKYISPEQVLGQPPSQRSDIYSLGVTLFEMIAGAPPFTADSAMSLMLKHVNQPVPDLRVLSPAAPAGLVAVVEKSLQKDPAQRYASAGEMAAVLRGLGGLPLPLPATAQPVAPPAQPVAPPSPFTLSGRSSTPTVVDTPAASAAAPRPSFIAPAPPPAQPGAPPASPAPPAPAAPRLPPPRAVASRRPAPRWALPLAALAVVSVLILCLVLTAGGGLLGMLGLRALATGTARPRPTPTAAEVPSDNPAFTLSPEPYIHPSAAFSIRLPEDWTVQDQLWGVIVTSPDHSFAIHVTFTNVGRALVGAGLESYIQAIETNWFGAFPAYRAGDSTTTPDGRHLVFKTLQVLDNPPQTVASDYRMDGAIVYAIDFWAPTNLYEDYAARLDEVAGSLATDRRAAAYSPLYSSVYTFAERHGLFTIDVPYAWTHMAYEPDFGTAEQFSSPAEDSHIGSIVVDTTQYGLASDTDEAAAFLLQRYYATTDIVITSSEPRPDGSVRLDWYSPNGGYSGLSYYETRGDDFLMLSWTVANDRYAEYLPVWETVVNSYTRR